MPINASKRKKARHPIKKPEKEDNVKTNKRPLLKGYKTTSLVPNPEKKNTVGRSAVDVPPRAQLYILNRENPPSSIISILGQKAASKQF